MHIQLIETSTSLKQKVTCIMARLILAMLILTLAWTPALSRRTTVKTSPLTKMLTRTQDTQNVKTKNPAVINIDSTECKDCNLDIQAVHLPDCSDCPSENVNCTHCNVAKAQRLSNVTGAFTAEIKDRKLINDAQQVTFNAIVIDVGQNFNNLGVFQCPDDDVYFISWSVHSYQGKLVTSLMKDGTVAKYGPVTANYYNNGQSGTSTMSSVVQCTRKSKLWVKGQYCLHLYPSAAYCNRLEAEYTSISGFKIFQDNFSSKVAFTAQLSIDSNTISPQIFDQEVHNYGGHYDAMSGTFTCPHSGFYVFALSTHGTTGTTATELRLNNVNQFDMTYAYNTYSQTYSDSGVSSGTVVIECNTGDIVDITRTIRTCVAETTSFSGFELFDPWRPIIAFHARLSRNEALLDGYTLKFDNVITNEGGFYFSNLGTFVCPDNEIYFFSWSIAMIGTTGDVRPTETRLMVGGNVWKKGPKTKDNYSNRYSSASTQSIVQCQYQTAVWVEAVMRLTPNTQMTFNYQYTYFTGFRIPSI